MTSFAYEAFVLGSAQDGGNPQVGAEMSSPNDRSAASLALVPAGGPPILVDASPDLRAQYRALRAAYPDLVVQPPFEAIVLTHGHMGHYSGLVHLGKEAAAVDALPCFASRSMIGFLAESEPWGVMLRDKRLVPRLLEPGEDTQVTDGLSVVGHPVPHRPDFTDALGLEFRTRSASLLYLPDIDAWDEWDALDDVFAGVDVAMVDATFYSRDEHPGRDLTKIPHPLVPETMERLERHLESTRIILTHLNWTNPLSDPGSSEAAAVTRRGFEVASDGMKVPL